MMRRAIKILSLLALAPILMGGGGINPPPPGAKIAKKPTFRATIVLDPHNAEGDLFGTVLANVTTTAKQASFQLRERSRGDVLYQAQFQALPNFPLSLGCDPALSAGRFLYTTGNAALLAQWVPPATLTLMLASQGIPVGPLNEPAITRIVSNQCVDDPQNQTIPGSGGVPVPGPGILVLEVVIEFQVF